ncbi:hypothetical protein CTI12_AA625930 [Artemisia annua]|uniref:Uncharacterized protein n=1 Tax=Artemisia annua TaxID=35608 RepID=A0A2U1KAD5_ARTAN|nr:hypothetical protein CTI12_AA625930 [Artemisia annua]
MAESDEDNNVIKPYLSPAKKKHTKTSKNPISGVPMGKMKLEDLEQRDHDDLFIAEWESQYSNVAKITPAAISTEITSTFDADFIFTINFLTLFASTMGTVDNGAKVFPTVLKHVKENDVISDIDWCGYILECLRTSRHNWEKVKKGDFYYGPATFLCLLYLDSTNFPQFQVMHHRPTMRSWNTQAMRKRIGMEIKENCLGKLEHHEKFDPEEEQTGLNFYKGMDVYNEPLPPKRPETKEAQKHRVPQEAGAERETRLNRGRGALREQEGAERDGEGGPSKRDAANAARKSQEAVTIAEMRSHKGLYSHRPGPVSLVTKHGQLRWHHCCVSSLLHLLKGKKLENGWWKPSNERRKPMCKCVV